MFRALPLTVGIALASLLAVAAHADNPWRGSADYYGNGNGSSLGAGAGDGGFGKPGPDRNFPPMDEPRRPVPQPDDVDDSRYPPLSHDYLTDRGPRSSARRGEGGRRPVRPDPGAAPPHGGDYPPQDYRPAPRSGTGDPYAGDGYYGRPAYGYGPGYGGYGAAPYGGYDPYGGGMTGPGWGAPGLGYPGAWGGWPLGGAGGWPW